MYRYMYVSMYVHKRPQSYMLKIYVNYLRVLVFQVLNFFFVLFYNFYLLNEEPVIILTSNKVITKNLKIKKIC